MRRLLATGVVASLVAAVATGLGAALARAAGVDLVVQDGAAIPASGVAFVTGVLSLVGVVLALALHRWSRRPAELFLRVAITLTALSLIPPLVSGDDAATVVTLVGLHLLAAVVVVPVLARSLRPQWAMSTNRE